MFPEGPVVEDNGVYGLAKADVGDDNWVTPYKEVAPTAV